MKTATDPYRILGILRAADIDQIKAAHRRLAKRYHPDGSTGNEKRFLAVQEAYQLLSDPQRRREWDRKHAPGPVRAKGAARGRSRTAGRGRGSSKAAAETPPAGTVRPRRPARDPSGRTRTWSAEGVPWWEDFKPGGKGAKGAARSGDEPKVAPDATNAPGGPDSGGPAIDFDVFNRSSGAAWSMAARQHFRKADEDLPSRGAWRYRGTQVVTGAEARKVAAEEAAADEAARSTDEERRSNADAKRRSSAGSGRRGRRRGTGTNDPARE
ncbi:MAG: DnaJ domain-containing protein [Chloroflexota bacterium]